MRACVRAARLVSNAAASPIAVRSLKRSFASRPPAIAGLLGSDSSKPSIDVEVCGFVRSVRKQKRVAFVALADGSTLEPIQVVLKPEQAQNLSNGAAVRVAGQWTASAGGGQQTHELQAQEVTVLGDHDASSYPMQKKYHSPEFLRTLPHLRCRLPTNALMLRLRSQAVASLTSFFVENDFVQTHTPIITSSDCEGAGEVFSVSSAGEAIEPEGERVNGDSSSSGPFFRSPKYLTVSAQLHLEALAQAVTKVWTLSPTFRAEKSETSRHLSEFYMLEAEMCFTDSLESVMDVAENMLSHVASNLQNSRVGEELLKARAIDEADAEKDTEVTQAQLAARWRGMTSIPWPRITYKHAIDVLKDAVRSGTVFEFTPELGVALQAEHEKYLAEMVGEGRPIFVTDYPKDAKAFYMSPSDPGRRDATGGGTVACFDLLVPDLCELAGGSLREHRLEELLATMRGRGMLGTTGAHKAHSTIEPPSDPADKHESNLVNHSALQWYLDLRKYGSAPHGGFGVGFDRLLCYLSGTPNIRDVVSFPRWHRHCDC